METSIKESKTSPYTMFWRSLQLACACVCMHMLNAYGSSLTRSVCCVTPVLRGHPSSAIWLCSSHQSWRKAGPWPSAMTDWRGARNSSPWLEACRPGAGGWQGPAMRVWWMGSGTGLVMCVSLCVCVQAHGVAFRAPLSLIWVTEGTEGKVMIGHSVRQNERTSFRSSYTQKLASPGSPRLSDTSRNACTHPPTCMHTHTHTAQQCTSLHITFSWVFILERWKTLFITDRE